MGALKQQCHTKPFATCGEWSHVANQCRGRNGGSKKVQSRGVSREVYGVSSDQPVAESLVPITQTF